MFEDASNHLDSLSMHPVTLVVRVPAESAESKVIVVLEYVCGDVAKAHMSSHSVVIPNIVIGPEA